MAHKRFKIIFVAILVLMAIGFLGLRLLLNDKHDWPSIQVTRKSLISEVLATGSLDATQKVDVGAQVNGQVKTLTVEIGSDVTKNQILGIIDPRQPLNQVKESEGSIRALKAQLDKEKIHLSFLERKVERERYLIKRAFVTKQEFDDVSSEMAMSQAEIQNIIAQISSKSAELDTARTNLEYTKIIAPINGTVTQITTHEGQTVIAAQQAPDILTIADMDIMLVNIKVSEADILQLKKGQTVWFTTLGASSKKYYGHLKDILPAPIKINDAVFYQARFEVPNTAHTLRLGMTVQVHIRMTAVSDVLTIPLAALGTQVRESVYHVILINKGKPFVHEIVTGVKNATDIQVLSGLKEGDAIVIGPDELSIKN